MQLYESKLYEMLLSPLKGSGSITLLLAQPICCKRKIKNCSSLFNLDIYIGLYV